VEGINYFFDTLLFTGAILALANAAPRAEAVERAGTITKTVSATGTESSAQQ